VYGDDQGLLVEAAGRTNQVLNSANFANWTKNGVTINDKISIIGGESNSTKVNAKEVDPSGSIDNRIQNGAGTFTGNAETYTVIAEKGSSGNFGIQIENGSTSAGVVRVRYDWSDDGSVSLENYSVQEINSRVLTTNGPQGGEVVRLVLRVSGANSENTSGESRQIWLFPDRLSGTDTTIFHHAQIEEAPNASSPIVTSGSAKTRAEDDYAIFSGGQPPWWNPNEGSFVVDFKINPPAYNKSKVIIGNGGTKRFINIFDGNVAIQDAQSSLGAGSIEFGVEQTVAVSFYRNTKKISLNGFVNSGSSNGELLETPEINIGEFERFIGEIKKITYIPRALPETTLNTLTS
jgi:hypothetical protein